MTAMIDPWMQSLVDHKEQQYQDIFTTLLMSGEYREQDIDAQVHEIMDCLLYTSPSPRDLSTSRMPSSA